MVGQLCGAVIARETRNVARQTPYPRATIDVGACRASVRCVTLGGEAISMTTDARAQQAAMQIGAVFEATTDGMLVIGALPGKRDFTIVDVNPELPP